MNWWRVCDDCQLENCLDCSGSTDPNSCQACKPGFFYDEELGVCGDCDNNPAVEKCLTCTGYEDQCTECAPGFRLATTGSEAGRCITCDDEFCADCNETVGGCDRCKVGYYLDLLSQTAQQCFPCTGNCKSCDDANTCNQCEDKGDMHFPKDINEDGCQCNEEEGWQQKENKPFECKCTRDFVNEDGFCVNCE